MVNQNNTERVRHDITFSWENAAKLRTVVKGKMMPAIEFKGRKIRKAMRKMSVGYFIEKLVEDRVQNVKPDSESIEWMVAGRKKAIARREKQDELVRKGANRKPKSEWKKCGRIAGKVYPKYVEAMKKLAAKRKAVKNNLTDK